MRFEASQSLRMGQHLKLAPRMIQSMEILQMPLAELEERIEQELESNPTLELVEPGSEAPAAADPRGALDAALDADDAAGHVDERGQDEHFERLAEFSENEPEAIENDTDGPGASSTEPIERDLTRSLSRLDDEASYAPARSDGERDAKMDAMASAPDRAEPLGEQLAHQWALVETDARTRALGEQIIAAIDEDGFLRTPLETLAERLNAAKLADVGAVRVEELADALSEVQTELEPAGVAARDTRECLLLQLRAASRGDAAGARFTDDEAGHLDPAIILVEDHLDDLMKNRLPRIAEKTGLTLDEIRGALGVMKKLSLAPARQLVQEQVRPIVPDAIIEFDAENDRYVAYLNDRRIPALRLNREYAMLARQKATPQRDKEFFRKNLSNAQWLIDAVEQRKGTVLRVVQAVADAQREFFDFGPAALKPLPMTGVAEKLGIHVATVSRAVADKHVLTPRGVMALRKFFSGGIQTRTRVEEPQGPAGPVEVSGGESLAWDAIKEALRAVVDAEDKAKPLSDEAIVAKLKDRGIDIARRTVAKYRDQLQIAPARMRKQF
jgi:RNA polymerase sigma-54 factor